MIKSKIFFDRRKRSRFIEKSKKGPRFLSHPVCCVLSCVYYVRTSQARVRDALARYACVAEVN